MPLTTQKEIKLWLQEKLGPKRSGTRKMLAAHLGVEPSKITRWANTEAGKESHIIPGDVLQKMKAFFGESLIAADEIVTHVPIMGFLGAGAEVDPDFEQVPPEGFDTVDLPFALPYDMIAFKVTGTSMIPAFRPNTIIIVHRDQRKPIESFYGEEAAVRTSDGRRYIKTIHKGALPGRVNLHSWNDVQPIENVRLEWIGEIYLIVPTGPSMPHMRRPEIRGHMKRT